MRGHARGREVAREGRRGREGVHRWGVRRCVREGGRECKREGEGEGAKVCERERERGHARRRGRKVVLEGGGGREGVLEEGGHA